MNKQSFLRSRFSLSAVRIYERKKKKDMKNIEKPYYVYRKHQEKIRRWESERKQNNNNKTREEKKRREMEKRICRVNE